VSRSSHVRLRASALLLLLLASLGIVGAAAPAHASTAQTSTTWQRQVIAEASRHKGAPYQYGAAGPSRFDCSGYTLYIYAKMHKSLPHNSSQQYSDVSHIARSRMQAGDLLFFRNSSGRISHVAIYAGGGTMWHSPHSGSVVQKIRIYSNSYVVGRP
jgi:cell wall-associated NlpC family hydrolase